jgi:hypothetical protein
MIGNVGKVAALALAVLTFAGCASAPREVPEAPTAESVPEPAPAITRHRPTEMSIDDLQAERAATPPPGVGEHIDESHDRLFVWTQGLVEGSDHYFAEVDREEQPVPTAPYRLGIAVKSLDRSDGLDFSLEADFDVEIKMPNIQRRMSLFVTSDAVDEAPRAAGEDTRLSAGVRYELLSQVDFDVGVRFDIPPALFTSLKWSNDYKLGKWDLYPYAKLFLRSDEGLGFSSSATFDRWVGHNVFRSSTYGKWLADGDKVKWTQTLAYAYVTEQLQLRHSAQYAEGRDIGKGFGIRLLAEAEAEDGGNVTSYEAGIFARWPSRNRWLFWYVEPLARWDRNHNWDGDLGIRIGFDALFWELARRDGD